MTSVLQEVLRPPKLGLQKPQVSPPQASSICGKRVWLWRRLCFYMSGHWISWRIRPLAPWHCQSTFVQNPECLTAEDPSRPWRRASKLSLCHFRFKEPTCMVWNLRLDLICSWVPLKDSKSLKRWIHWFNPFQRLELKKSLYRAFSIRGWCRCSITKTFFTRASKTCLPHSGHSRGHRPNAHFWITNAFFTLHASGEQMAMWYSMHMTSIGSQLKPTRCLDTVTLNSLFSGFFKMPFWYLPINGCLARLCPLAGSLNRNLFSIRHCELIWNDLKMLQPCFCSKESASKPPWYR